ncbi:MAG TPA: glycosyl hydrolase [Prolixibacteraceae bacterium]|nr:glycosyl hydrolase [Prolixibacteraceae bacterium]
MSFKRYYFAMILSSFFCIANSFAQSGTLVTSVEAESGTLYGGLSKANSISGYSGTGYITNFRNAPDSLSVTVSVPKTAFYSILIRYNSSDNKYQRIDVNGAGASDVYFPKSNGWANTDAGKFFLHSGDNSITIENSWGWVEIDQFQIYTTTLNSYDKIALQPVDEKANPATKSLYNFLLTQFGKRIISGQTDGYYNDIQSITGQSPMYRVSDFQHYTDGYSYKNGGFGWDDNGNTESMINWYNSTGKKGIVGFQWHWHSPSGGVVNTNTFYTENTTFDIRKAVIKGTIEYTQTIRDIDSIATQLKKLEKANVPVLWRPLHEAGGGWFWWGAHGGEACKQLYAILYDRITNYHQIHNLIWVWSSYETDWYPGNATVDIVGMDSYPGNYNYGTQKNTFDRYFNLTNGEKLITMSENGPIPDPDAPWSFFMSWYDLVLSQNSNQHLKDVYTNPRVLTLEKDTFPMIITATNASICGSGSVTLGATANFGIVNWFESETEGTILHTGTSFTTPVLSIPTTYYVEASYNGFPSGMKRTAVKATFSVPVAASVISGTSTVCQGANNVAYSLPFDANVDSYTWTLPSGATGTSTTNQISVNFGNSMITTGIIKVAGHNDCGDGAESSLEITITEIPLAPVITFADGIFQSDATSGNQWYFNSSPIGNAVNSTLKSSRTGDYYTIVTINDCISQPSNTISIFPTGVDKVEDSQICIYPNPIDRNNVKLNILGLNIAKDALYNIVDVNGKLIDSGIISGETIDLKKSLESGIYILNVNSDGEIYNEKLIVK